MNMFDTGTSVYSLPFRDQGVKEDPGSDGAADTTSDSDTALNLASGNKHGYEAPCSPGSYCESDIPSSPSCSKERHSSSPQDREASTSPTTSAIKTVQNILASLQAAQTPLSQLVALQAPHTAPLLTPWSLPLTPGLPGLTSEAGNMQQLYLQHQHHALQQTLHSLLPAYPHHNNGQTQTMLLQNQVQQAVQKATRELRLLQSVQASEKGRKQRTASQMPSPPLPSEDNFEEIPASLSQLSHISPPRSRVSPLMASSPIASMSSAFSPLAPAPSTTSPPLSISIPQSSQSSAFSKTTDNSSPKSASSAQCMELTLDENITLEELENFAREFKQQRIKLGYTQGDVGLAMGRMYGNDFSQTTISRFEALNLSFNNMCKLKPLLQKWLADADGTSTISVPNFNCHDLLGKRRKKRTSIENNIRYSLEKAFLQNPKPTSEEVRKISDTLYLEKEVVRVWFCNRRQKEKRVTPDSQVSPMSCYGGHVQVTPQPPQPRFSPGAAGPPPPLSFSASYDQMVTGRQVKTEAE